MKNVREPEVAGMFYPESASKLKDEVQQLLNDNKPQEKFENAVGIVSPHAGYIYSGRTAAIAFNAIKQKKYKTVQCALAETVQRKACRIDGDIEVIQMNPNKTLKKDPIGSQSNFENISSRALGDLQALNQQQLARTKSQIVPFPTDIEMVVRCSESLKKAIRGVMMNNKRFIQ